jgi:hypothetical protein
MVESVNWRAQVRSPALGAPDTLGETRCVSDTEPAASLAREQVDAGQIGTNVEVMTRAISNALTENAIHLLAADR